MQTGFDNETPERIALWFGDAEFRMKLKGWIDVAMSEYHQAMVGASATYKTVLFAKIEVLRNLEQWLKEA